MLNDSEASIVRHARLVMQSLRIDPSFLRMTNWLCVFVFRLDSYLLILSPLFKLKHVIHVLVVLGTHIHIGNYTSA